MKSNFVVMVLLAASSMPVLAAPVEGWYLAGDRAKSYEIGVDGDVSISGKPARFIRYVNGDDSKFGTLAQEISAKSYAGKRVRFQAMVKTRDVTQWAGLWMSALRPGEQRALAFYNSQDQPIAGSADWQSRSVTLDIPVDATRLHFGVIDAGKGQVWIDQLSLEAVGLEVPVDVMPGRHEPAAVPSL
jgi:hypothetical protein